MLRQWQILWKYCKCSYCTESYTVFNKDGTLSICHNSVIHRPTFKNFQQEYTGVNLQWADILHGPPHLIYVTALPCEITVTVNQGLNIWTMSSSTGHNISLRTSDTDQNELYETLMNDKCQFLQQFVELFEESQCIFLAQQQVTVTNNINMFLSSCTSSSATSMMPVFFFS